MPVHCFSREARWLELPRQSVDQGQNLVDQANVERRLIEQAYQGARHGRTVKCVTDAGIDRGLA